AMKRAPRWSDRATARYGSGRYRPDWDGLEDRYSPDALSSLLVSAPAGAVALYSAPPASRDTTTAAPASLRLLAPPPLQAAHAAEPADRPGMALLVIIRSSGGPADPGRDVALRARSGPSHPHGDLLSTTSQASTGWRNLAEEGLAASSGQPFRRPGPDQHTAS